MWTLVKVPQSHCGFCGHAFLEPGYTRQLCAHCGRITYWNPLPVACIIVPVTDQRRKGLIVIRRGREPQQGALALPGGFIEVGQTWQDAASRELFEEASIETRADDLRAFRVLSGLDDNTLLIFALAPPMSPRDLPTFRPNSEALERLILYQPTRLAFPLHVRVVEEYLKSANND